uniref:Type II toxin-antitoxin system HicA family toxin n=1 Tax=Strongyloides venezuelensis TaxID=75913 RepID=A0A0K0F1A9_STRVS
MLRQWTSFKLDTQYSGLYEVQNVKGTIVWLKPVNGGAIVKTHRKFLKKMLIDERSSEKVEGGSLKNEGAKHSKGERVILK